MLNEWWLVAENRSDLKFIPDADCRTYINGCTPAFSRSQTTSQSLETQPSNLLCSWWPWASWTIFGRGICWVETSSAQLIGHISKAYRWCCKWVLLLRFCTGLIRQRTPGTHGLCRSTARTTLTAKQSQVLTDSFVETRWSFTPEEQCLHKLHMKHHDTSWHSVHT